MFLGILLVICIASSGDAFAQSKDVLNQTKINGSVWSSEDEVVVTKKKKQNQATNNNVGSVNANIPQQTVKYTILNSCEENLTVELIELSGNKASQIVELTIRFTNHDVNQSMSIRSFVAYNEEGDEFSCFIPTSSNSFDTFTDVPVKTKWEVGQMLPSNNSKMTLISFKMNGCTIEMRDIPIYWK